MFKGKSVRVIFSAEVNEEYSELNRLVGEERRKGVRSSEHQTLLRSVQRAIELLRTNPFVGMQIPKRLVPKKYVQKYDVTNLWKLNLAGFWRMIYTVTSEGIEIISFVLDIIDHKTYDKIFGYRRK